MTLEKTDSIRVGCRQTYGTFSCLVIDVGGSSRSGFGHAISTIEFPIPTPRYFSAFNTPSKHLGCLLDEQWYWSVVVGVVYMHLFSQLVVSS